MSNQPGIGGTRTALVTDPPFDVSGLGALLATRAGALDGILKTNDTEMDGGRGRKREEGRERKVDQIYE